MAISQGEILRARDEVSRFERDLEEWQTKERSLRTQLTEAERRVYTLESDLTSARRKLRDLEDRERREEIEVRRKRAQDR